ncbi:DUF2088 domain-containing protein [Candidatus Bathyarchaeota archaeon]|nr:DUF2088 domain-containing protein [Candidatus Bathyarchaeota archaeon]
MSGDLSRPFKAFQILPAVLDELHAGGISDKHIRFVIAKGCHQWMTLDAQQKKLGEDIPGRFLVFNHNVFENLVDLGKTSQGTPVLVNKEVMSCDLKVAVHGIIPHRGAGFGGGSKIVLPGISSIETITYNHTRISEGLGKGRVKGNMRRRDMDEAAEMVGIDFAVNQIVNASRDCADLVCGDLSASHKEGLKIARKHYATRILQEADIAVGNGYPMDDEAYKVFGICIASVMEGGDVVVLIHTPEGCIGHYGNGRFGTDYGGPAATPWRPWGGKGMAKPPWKMKRILVMSPQYSLMDEWYYGTGSIWVKSWEKLLEKLTAVHGSEVDVAVYPCATIQMTEEEAAQE